MKNHSINFRVYYEDTDAGEVVYYARYLQFAERARTELLRELGYENLKIKEQEGKLFVVSNVNIKYLKPARLDDLLTVETGVKEVKNSSFVMTQKILLDKTEIVNMEVVLVCVDAIYFRPVRMPVNIRDAFTKYLPVV